MEQFCTPANEYVVFTDTSIHSQSTERPTESGCTLRGHQTRCREGSVTHAGLSPVPIHTRDSGGEDEERLPTVSPEGKLCRLFRSLHTLPESVRGGKGQGDAENIVRRKPRSHIQNRRIPHRNYQVNIIKFRNIRGEQITL